MSKALDNLINMFGKRLTGADYQIPVRNSTSFIFEPTTHTILFNHSREQTAMLCRRFLAYHTALPVLCITIKRNEFTPGERFLAYDVLSRNIDYGAYDGHVTYPDIEFVEKEDRTAIKDILANYRNMKILQYLKPLCDDIAKLDDLRTQMIGFLEIIKTDHSEDTKLMEIVEKDIAYTTGKAFSDPYQDLMKRCLDISSMDNTDDDFIQALRIR